MPLHSDIVGASTPALNHTVDARWLMAYAAALNDLNPQYMNTAERSIVAHPVFPVCVEWPVILKTREIAGAQSLSGEEAARGVHAGHDLHLYQPITPGQTLTTQATMIGVEAIKPGAAYTMRLDTTDASTGELVARTYQLGIYRTVAVAGAGHTIETPPKLPAFADLTDAARTKVTVPANAAHIYTECARIWNPIHTDKAVAKAAGLPDIILHGTATLALAVSAIVNRYAAGEPHRVRRLGGRFTAMVLMPSHIEVVSKKLGHTVSFEVLNAAGEKAISQGFVVLD